MTKTAIPTKPKSAVPETIYVNDPDGKKFFQMDNHDAMTLDVNDLVWHNDRLCRVTTVKRKHTRQGVNWFVVLNDGHGFDPSADDPELRNITFWRPRKGL
jgi:hypothetical protein